MTNPQFMPDRQRYRLISVKETKYVTGTLAEALGVASRMDEELQSAFGVTVEDERGVTVAEVGGSS